MMNPQLVSLGHDTLTPVYTSLLEPTTKKRKHSQDTSQVKCEPGLYLYLHYKTKSLPVCPCVCFRSGIPKVVDIGFLGVDINEN
jgi:hypothetical protein